METKRQLDVLERRLSGKDGRGGGKYIVGDQYTIADMMIYPWYGVLTQGKLYGNAVEFLQVGRQTQPHCGIRPITRASSNRSTAFYQ
mmetsp:Transcript_3870/g.7419  ORF Transcript_3870/g.7419 Transcript_3870/m.7419 type:complete len:87 (-) Transcript_3870:717-977(-)